MDQQKKIFIMLMLCGLLLVIVGIGIGYLSNYKGNMCQANPLIYGVSELNDLNKADLVCSCASDNGLLFSFDENKFMDKVDYYEFRNIESPIFDLE